MNTDLLLLKTYFGWTSLINSEKAARKSFRLFQKVRKKNIRRREEGFFASSRKFQVWTVKENVDCFEIGNPNGEVVILVHGWDSNAGSMSKIALALAEQNKRVIAFNLPGHAFSKSSSTNLIECKDAFLALVDFLNLKEPFSIVAHSFGSAVSTYALAKSNYQVDKIILLTNPNKIEEIFKEFKTGIGLGNRAYKKLLDISTNKLGESLDNLTIQENLKKIQYKNLLMIHDKFDKVLSYKHSNDINNEIENAQLISLENIGHYKMLWNDEVINRCVGFVNGKEVF